MSANAGAYHVLELQIACDPADTRRVMPAIRSNHRRVLDVGCGAGQTLFGCTLDTQVTALGIDRDFEALRLGRKLGSPASLVCARGESLPLASGYFDLVMSRVSLPYMKTGVALAEMTRVLAPGGTLWLTLHPFHQAVAELVEQVRRRNVRGVLHRLYVLANGAWLHATGREFKSPFDGRHESFQTETGIVADLQRLGFHHIDVRKGAFFVVTATRPGKAR
jgi:ubiquinone/menaquinone biosynthesis C-methylase UbiE